MISKAIGRAFDVAYHEFLRTHGIEEEGLAHSDYIDVLSVQKMPLEDLNLFSDKKAEREVPTYGILPWQYLGNEMSVRLLLRRRKMRSWG